MNIGQDLQKLLQKVYSVYVARSRLSILLVEDCDVVHG